jgi:peptide/nickel transport system permease protein
MRRLVLTRLAALPAILLATAALTFTLAWLSPYDPAATYVAGLTGQDGTSMEVREAYARTWGLDEPAHVQFGAWLGNVVRGDLGISRLVPGEPVLGVVAARLGPTLLLLATAMALVLVGSLVAGTLAARFQGSPFDTAVRGVAYLSTFAPSFWVALLAIWVFGVWGAWLPTGGTGDLRATDGGIELRYLVLPAATLALSQQGWFTLYVRDTVLERMRDDHVVYAVAQGASRTRAVARQALPTALLPYVTLIGTHLPELIGGSILIESVFGWPGLGNLARRAAVAVDVPLLLAIVLVGAVLVVLGNLLADVLYGVLDPRTRRQERV